jgi:putative FmdB family regulatory protein
MPIYEYRCPKGHTFERFQSMTAPSPEKCDVCGASPVEIVLYPVAVHYKGSGFYSTDYGKGKAAKKDGAESGGSSGGDSGGDSGGSSSGDSGGKSDSAPAKSDSSSSTTKPEKKSSSSD